MVANNEALRNIGFTPDRNGMAQAPMQGGQIPFQPLPDIQFAAPVAPSSPMVASPISMGVLNQPVAMPATPPGNVPLLDINPGTVRSFADGGMVPRAGIQGQPMQGGGQGVTLEQMQADIQRVMQANPQGVEQIRQLIMQGIQSGELTMQELNMAVQMAIAAAQNPELYPRLRQMAIQNGLAEEGDLPMQYDPGLVYTLILAGQAVMQGGGAGGGVQAPAAPMAQAPGGMAPPPPAAAAAPGGMPAMALGGYLPPEASPTGDNTGKADDIPIRVSGGEYVIPRNVVERKGTEFFDKMIGKDTATA